MQSHPQMRSIAFGRVPKCEVSHLGTRSRIPWKVSMSETATGILKRVNKEQFSLRTGDRSYRTGPLAASVPFDLVRRFSLVEGAMITGQGDPKKGKSVLASIETVGGLRPEEFRKRPRFTDLG